MRHVPDGVSNSRRFHKKLVRFVLQQLSSKWHINPTVNNHIRDMHALRSERPLKKAAVSAAFFVISI